MICDVKTFSQMYETVYQDMYRFALGMMHHAQDAEDSVSEAVISAYENINKLRNPDAFKSWIFTILSNVCKKKLGSSARKDGPLEGDERSEQTDLELPVDVRKAFFILSEEERLIVALSVFAGYNSSEIGKMRGINANTVRSKRKRALEKMSCVLDQ